MSTLLAMTASIGSSWNLGLNSTELSSISDFFLSTNGLTPEEKRKLLSEL